jgi:hypothetical protein
MKARSAAKARNPATKTPERRPAMTSRQPEKPDPVRSPNRRNPASPFDGGTWTNRPHEPGHSNDLERAAAQRPLRLPPTGGLPLALGGRHLSATIGAARRMLTIAGLPEDRLTPRVDRDAFLMLFATFSPLLRPRCVVATAGWPRCFHRSRSRVPGIEFFASMVMKDRATSFVARRATS